MIKLHLSLTLLQHASATFEQVAGLLRDAILRTLWAADIAGIRAFTFYAKNDAAQAFYRHFGFVESPTDPLHLFALIKDLRGL